MQYLSDLLKSQDRPSYWTPEDLLNSVSDERQNCTCFTFSETKNRRQSKIVFLISVGLFYYWCSFIPPIAYEDHCSHRVWSLNTYFWKRNVAVHMQGEALVLTQTTGWNLECCLHVVELLRKFPQGMDFIIPNSSYLQPLISATHLCSSAANRGPGTSRNYYRMGLITFWRNVFFSIG